MSMSVWLYDCVIDYTHVMWFSLMLVWYIGCSTNDAKLEEMKKEYTLQQDGKGPLGL